MITCPERKIIPLRIKNVEPSFQTTYTRSYFHEIPIAQPLYCARVKTEIPGDLKTRNSHLNNYVSVYNKTYNTKYIGEKSDFYGRTCVARKPQLKIMHEKYEKDLIKPIKYGLTRTGSTYVPPKDMFETPLLREGSPIDDVTCPVRAFGKDEFPSIPPNEGGMYKHTDIFVSTAHMTHVNFTAAQRNQATANDTITYHNAASTSDRQGTDSKTGSAHDFVLTSPYTQISRAVPYKAEISTYKASYNPVLRNLIPWSPNVRFPPIFKLSRDELLATPAMYCTELSRGRR